MTDGETDGAGGGTTDDEVGLAVGATFEVDWRRSLSYLLLLSDLYFDKPRFRLCLRGNDALLTC